jgi:hypothetical protein
MVDYGENCWQELVSLYLHDRICTGDTSLPVLAEALSAFVTFADASLRTLQRASVTGMYWYKFKARTTRLAGKLFY